MSSSFQDPKVTNTILSDVQAINELLGYLAQLNPSLGTNYPAGSIRLVESDTTNHYYTLQIYDGTTWTSIARILNDSSTLRGYAPSTSAVAGTIPVYNSSGQLVGNITGNAASATKLASSCSIQVGGIAASTAQNFNGTANITIPINRITVNNDADNALNGVVSHLHGGTGRTDGASQDVVISTSAGNMLAKSVGQIGTMAHKGDVDFDTVVVQGAYRVICSSGMVKHQPRIITNTGFLLVYANGELINQLLIMPVVGEMWIRRSSTTGASFDPWFCLSGLLSNVHMYISKSGSNNNTGFESAYPCLTISRALQIASNLCHQSGGSATVVLHIGAGEWSSLDYRSLPFRLYLYPYDGAIPSEYSNQLPVFESLYVENSSVFLYGCVFNKEVRSGSNGYIYFGKGYKRVTNIIAEFNGIIKFVSDNSATNILEFVKNQSINSYHAILAEFGGQIYFEGYIHIRLAENININFGSFIHISSYATVLIKQGMFVVDTSSYSFSGNKFSMDFSAHLITWESNAYPSNTSGLPAILYTLPGTDVSVYKGAIINGSPVGFDYASNLVAKAGDTMTGNLTIKKAAPFIISQDTNLNQNVKPSTDKHSRTIVSYDINGAEMGGIDTAQLTSGNNETVLFTARNVSGTWKYANIKSGLDATGKAFFYAGYPYSGANSNNNDIATTQWVQERLTSVKNSIKPSEIGSTYITGNLVSSDWTLTNCTIGKLIFILANIQSSTLTTDNNYISIRVSSGATTGTTTKSDHWFRLGDDSTDIFAIMPTATTVVIRAMTGTQKEGGVQLRAYQ